jgi:hypothetical protein
VRARKPVPSKKGSKIIFAGLESRKCLQAGTNRNTIYIVT